jgi:hypothetical protein
MENAVSLGSVLEILPHRMNSTDAVAEEVWRVMNDQRFAKSRRQDLTLQAPGYLDLIRRAIQKGEPLKFAIILFPFKIWRNPLKTDRRTPDLGELATLNQLASLSYAIRHKYAPGASWTILTEGEAYQDLFGVPTAEINAYLHGIKRFVSAMGEDQLFEFKPLSQVMDGFPDFTSHLAKRLVALDNLWEQGVPPKYADYYWTFFTSQDVRDVDPETLMRIYGNGKKNALPKAQDLPTGDRDVFRRIDAEASRMMRWYLAYNQAKHDVGRGGAIPTAFPDHLYVSVTDKPGRYTLHPLNNKTRLFPHHGVPVVSGRHGAVSIQWLHGARSRPDRIRPVYLEGDSEELPFYYIEDPNGE